MSTQAVAGPAPHSRSLRTTIVCSMLAAGIASTPVFAHNDDDRDRGPVVNTTDGSVRGFSSGGVYRFLGIPYAAPPIGNLRWRPPAPVQKWRDTRDATRFGNPCPQVTELRAFAGPPSTTEDCLYLNVFTTRRLPGPEEAGHRLDPRRRQHRPARTDGYDGSKLATGGPLAHRPSLVTINYRLGLFGFLSQSHLNAEGHPPGNYGILDSPGGAPLGPAATSPAFGGDPNNVTLGGQSAGARSTRAR